MPKKVKAKKVEEPRVSDDELLKNRMEVLLSANIEKKEEEEKINSTRLKEPISALYKEGVYPKGEIVYFVDGPTSREKDEKQRKEAIERFDIEKLRKGAEVHRQVRTWTQGWIKPGMRMIDITDHIEDYLAFLIEKDGIKAGQAFPTGCSLNSVAAHWTPNSGDRTVLSYDDVCKIDFGTQVEGAIIDSAWTVTFNPVYDELKNAVQAATNAGIKEAGIDVRLCDVGEKINEVMTSYEVCINNKVYPVKPIKNLHGHSMERYTIHAGKSVPLYNNKDTTKMEEGELYAIETFGSTGKGRVVDEYPCSHYMIAPDASSIYCRTDKERKLFNHIKKTFSTLAFSRKWLDRTGFERHILTLNSLVKQGLVEEYPALTDTKGCFTAQYEHSILLRSNCKEILSRGEDY
ncbi:methionyl aminopeptidase 2 like [Perkinsela sp. CCAP 1560/4]|nr:methionyl aminopeptidase 2 like [Perkinsela sp. CCAP 1560/4]|eukprot:KNH06716.1 methionyl aminopeptidase 2 like [Perkinsela sp. CCAP 1560/4]